MLIQGHIPASNLVRGLGGLVHTLFPGIDRYAVTIAGVPLHRSKGDTDQTAAPIGSRQRVGPTVSECQRCRGDGRRWGGRRLRICVRRLGWPLLPLQAADGAPASRAQIFRSCARPAALSSAIECEPFGNSEPTISRCRPATPTSLIRTGVEPKQRIVTSASAATH